MSDLFARAGDGEGGRRRRRRVGEAPLPFDPEAPEAGHRQRLRQRLLAGGGEAFQDHELLEYVLALAIPRRDTKPIAKELLNRFGTFGAVLAAEPEALVGVEGVSEASAAALKFVEAATHRMLAGGLKDRALIGNPQALIDYLHARLAHNVTEQVRCLFLNNRNLLITDEVISDGRANQSALDPVVVVRRALMLGATAIILVHNHPSGDPTPSRDDIAVTRQTVEAAKLLGITVHDHIVIGANGHASLRALGLM